MFNPRHFLQQIKLKDSPSLAYQMLNDEGLCNIVNAWRKISVEWNPPDMIESELSDPEINLLDILWKFSNYNIEDIALAAGMSEEAVLILMARAKNLSLVFPDGTIATSALKIIDTKVGIIVGKMVRQATGGKGAAPKQK